MGSDCDDVGALALLHAYADLGMAEIVACIYSSGKIPYGAGVTEAVNIYYGRPDIPIGADHKDDFGDPVDKMQAEKLAKDTAAFKNKIILNTETFEQTALNRKILVESEDHSITYLTIGHTRGLYELLLSEADEISPLTGYELVELKVKRWVALGAKSANNGTGKFNRDWNFSFNGAGPYTRYLVENFPRPCHFTAGTKAKTGSSLKYTPPGNIVRTAYRDWLWNWEQKTLDDQRHSSDLMAVYYAVEGLGSFLEEAPHGYLEVHEEEGSRWIKSEQPSNHSFIAQKPGLDAAFAGYLNEMIARPPALRN